MALKNSLRFGESWNKLQPYQQHALDAICMKMARSVNGSPTYSDTYHDIAGYAALVEKILNGDSIHDSDSKT